MELSVRGSVTQKLLLYDENENAHVNVQSKTTGIQFSLLHEPNLKVIEKKLKRKPLISPVSVKAVR